MTEAQHAAETEWHYVSNSIYDEKNHAETAKLETIKNSFKVISGAAQDAHVTACLPCKLGMRKYMRHVTDNFHRRHFDTSL